MPFKLLAVGVLYIFVPLTAFTYHFSRRHRREIEVARMLALLKVDTEYAKAYAAETLFAYLWAVAYASIIVGFGLAMLFFSVELGLVDAEFPAFAIAGVDFPQRGSRIVFAMAFLGAYLSGLQHIYRRYAANDLSPTLYYGLAMRIILAAIVAVIIYNAYTALAGTSESDSGITANIWPALAFLIGIFPQRGLRWMSDRTPMLSQAGDPAVRPAPLEMIEGVEAHDVLRLEELGIDNCYDLATADFIPVLLKTPYSAQAADRLDSAGEAVRVLWRQRQRAAAARHQDHPGPRCPGGGGNRQPSPRDERHDDSARARPRLRADQSGTAPAA